MTLSITFFSNYFNSHQEPVASLLVAQKNTEYTFVSLESTDGTTGRVSLDRLYPYVLRAYEGDEAKRLAMGHATDDDVVIFANVPGMEPYVHDRVRTGKPFLRYTERLLKRGDWWSLMPPKRWRTWNRFGRYKDSPMYVLCASAYASRDLARFGFPVERCLKWGYFPQVDSKPGVPAAPLDSSRRARLCSAQRLIPWKHVDLQIEAAVMLKELGYNFSLVIAGSGECEGELRRMVEERGLEDCIEFAGVLSHEDTLALMLRSDVYLATSDRNEGWGATVNEAMASGCTVVASDLIGSVPYLIRDGVDGIVFESGNAESLANGISKVLDDKTLHESLRASAMERIATLWSSEAAAQRLFDLSQALSAGERLPSYEEGPLSPAEIVEEDWHRRVD